MMTKQISPENENSHGEMEIFQKLADFFSRARLNHSLAPRRAALPELWALHFLYYCCEAAQVEMA